MYLAPEPLSCHCKVQGFSVPTRDSRLFSSWAPGRRTQRSSPCMLDRLQNLTTWHGDGAATLPCWFLGRPAQWRRPALSGETLCSKPTGHTTLFFEVCKNAVLYTFQILADYMAVCSLVSYAHGGTIRSEPAWTDKAPRRQQQQGQADTAASPAPKQVT